MKKIRIEFTFTDEEWRDALEHYSEGEVRAILQEGGFAELWELVAGNENSRTMLEMEDDSDVVLN